MLTRPADVQRGPYYVPAGTPHGAPLCANLRARRDVRRDVRRDDSASRRAPRCAGCVPPHASTGPRGATLASVRFACDKKRRHKREHSKPSAPFAAPRCLEFCTHALVSTDVVRMRHVLTPLKT